MNYRHIYHAGSFSDVIKHCVLVLLISALKRKEKPFCVLDTHAGIGHYLLLSKETQKKCEYQQGIAPLWEIQKNELPTLLAEYIAIVNEFNVPGQLNFYPGSPLITLTAMRENDRLIACELHKEDVETLKQAVQQDERAAIHHMNGYHAMKAFLPPKEARGLVLIDPPFEKTSEFDDIVDHIELALARWRGGTYAIWYPIKDRLAVNKFYRALSTFDFPQLKIEFSLNDIEEESGLTSCGVVIINPPWKTQELLQDDVLPYLGKILNASWSIKSENA